MYIEKPREVYENHCCFEAFVAHSCDKRVGAHHEYLGILNTLHNRVCRAPDPTHATCLKLLARS